MLGQIIDHSPPPERPAFLKPGETPPVVNPTDPRVSYLLWGLLSVGVVAGTVGSVRLFRAVSRRQDGGGET